MKKSRFTESRVVSVLRQVDTGTKVEDGCRERGMNDPVYYNWKSTCGGMEAFDYMS